MPSDVIPPNDYAPAEWRLLISGFLDGPSNMACDEAILESVAAGDSPPTLRFYGWVTPTISLGFRQSWDVVDARYCIETGWDVVRRPTGGRAILHTDELTYSVCAPVGEPRVRGGVLESYQRLSEALLAGLAQMALDPIQSSPEPGPRQDSGLACFDNPSDYEITVNGRKLVGSAQVRKRNAVLQHGTLPLFGDVTRIAWGLKFEDEKQRRALINELRKRAITLEEALGREVSFDEAANLLRSGFVKALNLNFFEGDLTEEEKNRLDELRMKKYADDSWTKAK